VRVLETRRIFQSVADRAIHADVSEPDEGDLQAGVRTVEDAHDGERDRERFAVGGVVKRGADLWAEEVSGRTNVGCEQQNEEQPPLVVGAEIEHDGCDEKRSSLDPQKHGWQAVEHVPTLSRRCRK
jgi:hypothetical protein